MLFTGAIFEVPLRHMTFDDLNLGNSLQKAINDLGYTTPTTIQGKAFSVLMFCKDVCGIAQIKFRYLVEATRL